MKLELKLVPLNTREQYVPPLNIVSEILGAHILIDGVDTGFVTNKRLLRWQAGVYTLEKDGYLFLPELITEDTVPTEEKTITFTRKP